MFKKIIIPVAAFAVTVTGVSAFSGDMLSKLNIYLTDTQVSTLEQVHEMHQSGASHEEVRSILDEAGIGRDMMHSIREARHKQRMEVKQAVREALDNKDFVAFKNAVSDTPRDSVIETEAQFQKLLEARELRKSGDNEGARSIMSELGIEWLGHSGHDGMRGHHSSGMDRHNHDSE